MPHARLHINNENELTRRTFGGGEPYFFWILDNGARNKVIFMRSLGADEILALSGFWTTGNESRDFMCFFGADEILILCDLWSKWEEKRVCRKTKVALALEGRENTSGGVGTGLESFQKLSK
jgi:hypothetical protein